ncbi:T9SS type A sorting domain-containing protein [Aestuariibaculum sediminum]|uniref:T9SS type A sorting domain-containing protein n=1 Tax=Aestuariibaculum sediminum TaxID=2770637 RepID=A0A8J6QF76_9FLAO|nr:T9SS type A sorting domain-containing protein [Aestuariibaculum sediminum]MBD0830934.1 T9SS type A sorting domain-containing protein [Aestuariibaculum sediminum]
MKKQYFTIFNFLVVSLLHSQVVIYQEDFETDTNGTNYFTSISEFTDKSTSTGYDFFKRTDGSDIGSAYEISNINNSYFFGAQDIDGEGATLPVTLSTKPIDVSSMSTIEFSILIAEDDNETNENWDNPDYVHITYALDSGAPENLLWIEGDNSSGGSTNNTPRIDTNFDGTGDGAEITSTFTEYSKIITLSSNSTIQFTIEYDLNAADEDLAIDNIRVINTTPLSVKENNIAGFKIYPNPTTIGFVNINSKNNSKIEVSVFSLLGKQILKQSVTNKLDVSGLNQGVYIIKATQNNKSITKKLIVK